MDRDRTKKLIQNQHGVSRHFEVNLIISRQKKNQETFIYDVMMNCIHSSNLARAVLPQIDLHVSTSS